MNADDYDCGSCFSRDLMHWTKRGPTFRKHAPDRIDGSRSGVVVSRRVGDRLIAAKPDGKYWMYYTHPCSIAWRENLIDWVSAQASLDKQLADLYVAAASCRRQARRQDVPATTITVRTMQSKCSTKMQRIE